MSVRVWALVMVLAALLTGCGSKEEQHMTILCYGDSNTYGYDPRNYGGRYGTENRWVDCLAANTGWTVYNEGENGREIPRTAQARKEAAALVEETQPDRMVILLGTNDLLQGTEPAVAAERMESFLEALPLENGQVLLIAPPPLQLGAWVADPILTERSKELTACYRALAERLGIGFADAGDWQLELAYDGVHFSEAAHGIFAEKLAAILSEPMVASNPQFMVKS